MASIASVAGNSRGHLRILGVCWIAYGIFRLVMAIWLVAFSGTATLMFGALLTRVANPFVLMSDFHVLYTVSIVLSVLCGVLGILAGLAFMASQRPRALGLLAAFFSVSEIPLGTTLGIYTFVVLLRSSDASR
ncbi:MAG: hypothetical protein WAK91_11410 [Candidatus Acidiferrales bacterium]|jgi:hypothetical protein